MGSRGAFRDPRSGWHQHRLNSSDWLQVPIAPEVLGPLRTSPSAFPCPGRGQGRPDNLPYLRASPRAAVGWCSETISRLVANITERAGGRSGTSLDRLGVGTRVRKDGPAQTPQRSSCPRCLRKVSRARPHPDKQCPRPGPGARKRARVIAEACEYPQASCQSGPGPWDLSVTSLWGSGARYLHTLTGPG